MPSGTHLRRYPIRSDPTAGDILRPAEIVELIREGESNAACSMAGVRSGAVMFALEPSFPGERTVKWLGLLRVSDLHIVRRRCGGGVGPVASRA
jgi:hypothetical protein